MHVQARGPPSLQTAKETVQKVKSAIVKEGKSKKSMDEKRSQKEGAAASKSSEAGNASGGNSNTERPLIAKDFFWDDWHSYVASAVLALALIDLFQIKLPDRHSEGEERRSGHETRWWVDTTRRLRTNT